MKRLLMTVLMAGYITPAVFAQVRGDERIKFYLESGYRAGSMKENYDSYALTANYASPVNATQSKLKYSYNLSQSYSLQFGYFIDRKRRFALQTGLIYSDQQGDLGVDTFHIEFKARDYKGNIYREVVTADHGIHESIRSQHVSIPVVARYNVWLSDRFSLNVNAGILYNSWLKNTYNIKANFDYEAIYQFTGSGSNVTTQYDASPVPDSKDWLITKAEYLKDNPKGSMEAYFNDLRAVGYNVGLHKPVSKNSGDINYSTKKLGYIGELELGFLLTKNLAVKLGAFYATESFRGKPRSKNMMTSKPGEYNPILNYTKEVTMTSYGVTAGLAYNFYSYQTMRYKKN